MKEKSESEKSQKEKLFFCSVQMKSIERESRKKDSIGFIHIKKNPINKNLFCGDNKGISDNARQHKKGFPEFLCF